MSDEDHGRVERLELALEPFEALDVQVVRRLVEKKEIRVACERACQRRARQLAARERVELAIEVGLDEAEPADGGSDPIPPCPATCVLELSLCVGIAPQRCVVVGAACHGLLEPAQI